jgi:hypothetical protein
VSKAFEKSTNVQYNIFPRDIYIEINACKLNMLSNVLCPFLPENEKDQEIDFDSVDRENVHNILNSPITEEEILQVVKIFKSNKASGYDDIVNEIFFYQYCLIFSKDLLDQSLTFS